MLTGYLCGPIFEIPDSSVWRETVKTRIKHVHWLDPTRRTSNSPEMLIKWDKEDILLSDFAVAYAVEPSWGTAMEIYFAHQIRIPVFGLIKKKSPWLVYHLTTLDTVFESWIKRIETWSTEHDRKFFEKGSFQNSFVKKSFSDRDDKKICRPTP